MAQETIIQQVDSTTFEYQQYIPNDEQILTSFNLDTTFSYDYDSIESNVYDENHNLLYNETAQYNKYPIINGDVVLDPEKDLSSLGFNNGIYYINYNFFKRILSSDKDNLLYIGEISSERTEIRLFSHLISVMAVKKCGCLPDEETKEKCFNQFKLK